MRGILKQFFVAAVLAVAVLCACGAFFRSRLDAITSASAHDPRFPRDRLHGIYLLGVNSELPLSSHVEALHSAFTGGEPSLADVGRVTMMFPSGDAPLAQFALRAAERLRSLGAEVSTVECSPVMLRSRALAGAFELLIAPSRVILRSDVDRLGFVRIKSEEMGWSL